MRREQADEADGAGHGRHAGGSEPRADGRPAAHARDVHALPRRHVFAEPQRIQVPRLGQEERDARHGQRRQGADGRPIRRVEAAEEPAMEFGELPRRDEAADDHDGPAADDAERHARQQERLRAGRRAPRQRQHQPQRAGRPQQRQGLRRIQRPQREPQERTDPREERAEARAAGDAQRPWLGQRIAENHLQRRAGHRQRSARQQSQQNARQADLEENHAVGRPIAHDKPENLPKTQFFGPNPRKNGQKSGKNG